MSVEKRDFEASDRRPENSGGSLRLSRADFLKQGSAVAGALALGGPFAACGGSGDGGTASGGTVNWLSWPGHNDASFIKPFEKETGINVRGKEYSGGDNMLALATSSPPGTYNVVQADAEYIPQLYEADMLEPLDPAEFPEIQAYFDRFKPESELVPGLIIDGKVYGLIQRFGLLSLAYNTDKVTDEEASSYGVLWEDTVKGKVGWLDWWAHMGPISLYLGKQNDWWPPDKPDPYNITNEQFEEVKKAVFSLKPQTAGFYAIGDIFGAFANGEMWIQPAGGDWTALLLEAEGHPIKASVPKEGAIQWTETLALMKGASDPEAAKKFIHYALGPRGQVQTAILPSYQAAIPSKDGWELMNDEKPDWAKRLKVELDGPNILDLYEQGLISIRKLPVQQTIEDWNKAWTEFKSL